MIVQLSLQLGLTCLDSLEKIVKEASANGEHEKITKIVDQLCHEYAYAVHQPHARNGGLIGLAAASIALGTVSQGWDLRWDTWLIGLTG